MIYTGENLIAEIRTIGGIPSNEVPGYTKAEILAHAAAVIRSRLLPLILKHKESYFLQRERIPLVVGQDHYRIPSRAVGDTLRAVWYIDSAGNRSQELNPIPLSDLHLYPSSNSSVIHGFYLTANHIVCVGNPGSGSLEVLFPFRVGDIVLATAARQVVTVTPATKRITISDVPTAWASGGTADIHSALGGHDLRVWGNPFTVVAPPPAVTLQFTNAIDGTTTGTFAVVPGDWMCLERQSALVALPEELIPALARGVALRIAEAEKDMEGMAHHQQQMVEDVGAATPLIADQVPGRPKYIRGTRSPYSY